MATFQINPFCRDSTLSLCYFVNMNVKVFLSLFCQYILPFKHFSLGKILSLQKVVPIRAMGFLHGDFHGLSISQEKACNILGWKIKLLQTSNSKAPSCHDKVLKRRNCFFPYIIFPFFYFPSDMLSNS